MECKQKLSGEMLQNIKTKFLTKEQLMICIDRLTRFKIPEEKYLRVFKDVISMALIFPSIKKNDIEKLDYVWVKNVAEQIINSSLQNLGYDLDEDYVINQRIYDYENSIFKISDSVNIFLKNKINYKSFLELAKDENLPFNLKWLKALASNSDIKETRQNEGFKFPLEKIILAEGITEEVLLPVFAKVCGYDFGKNGIYIISAGGKNQVVKYFYKFSQNLRIPIFVLLDSDAQDNYRQIAPKLRTGDRVHVINCGEFEDLLPLHLIEKALAVALANISIRDADDIDTNLPMAKNLEEMFKKRGLHEFKKAEFAQIVKTQIAGAEDVSPEIKDIFSELRQFIDVK